MACSAASRPRLALAVLMWAAPAHADDNPQRNTLTFRPSPHAEDIFGVQTARLPKVGSWNAGVWLTLNDKPLKVSDVQSGAEVRVVARQIVAEPYVSFVALDRLALGLSLPVFAQSTGSPLPAELRLSQVQGSSLGDARLSARYVLQGGDGLRLAVAEDVGLPTATGRQFNGDAGVTSETRVVASLPLGPLQVAVNAGFAARKAVTVLGKDYGNQWIVGAAGVLPVMCGKLDVLGALDGRTAAGKPFGDYQDGQLDGIVGARLRFGDLAATAAAGGGLVQGFGSAAFRATLGVAWLPQDPAVCSPDNDGDGVGGSEDQCPAERGPPVTHGCPDDDGDGVANSADKCPGVQGVAMYGGCTPTDSDGDGLADHEDRCRMAAGPKAYAGCPDSDGDGVNDLDDKCPTDKGEVAKGGCPHDSDGDGLHDGMDKCPDVAGPKERQGCPEQRVVVTATKVAITERIFFETGENKIKKESLSLIDEIAGVLKNNPQIKKVRIEGHTDNVGDPADNLRLSTDRAHAVRKYLVSRGLAANRLEAQGFGDSKPLADNGTDEGRAKNRRVEFVIVEKGG